MDKYLVFDPDGTIRVVEIERDRLAEGFRQAIGCARLESVRTIIADVRLVVDESGKCQQPPKALNELASRLFIGHLCGADYIAGSAVLAAIVEVDGESDWGPLNESQLDMLRMLGFKIPENL